MLFHKHHLEGLRRLLQGFESELIHMHMYGTKTSTRVAQVEQSIVKDLRIFERLNNYMRKEEHVLKKYMRDDDSWTQKHIPQLMQNLQKLEFLLQQYLQDITNLKRSGEKGLQEVRHHGRFGRTQEILDMIESITSVSKTIARKIKEEEQRLVEEKKRVEKELSEEQEIEHNIESWLF